MIIKLKMIFGLTEMLIMDSGGVYRYVNDDNFQDYTLVRYDNVFIYRRMIMLIFFF